MGVDGSLDLDFIEGNLFYMIEDTKNKIQGDKYWKVSKSDYQAHRQGQLDFECSKK